MWVFSIWKKGALRRKTQRPCGSMHPSPWGVREDGQMVDAQSESWYHWRATAARIVTMFFVERHVEA
jgi:hypothetical protein